MLDEISTNVAEAIPYKNFKDKIKIVNIELKKNRHVEIVDELNYIYSAEKWRGEDGNSRNVFN